MKIRILISHLAFMLFVGVVLTPNVWANIIVNGGFEQQLSGWTYDKAEIAVGSSSGITYFNPYEGSYSVDLEGSGSGNLSGSVSQLLATNLGDTYTLKFAMGGNYWVWSDYIKNPDNPPVVFETKYLEILWNNSSLGQFSYDLHTGDTITNFTWDLHTIIIPQSLITGSDTLEFRSINPAKAGYGALIDAVDLSAAPVPEPATLMLLGSGLLGLAGFRKKMKK